MTNNERLCFQCTVPMKKAVIRYKDLELEARQCPRCKDRIFTEELARKAAVKLEAQRLDAEYVKHPIKIGHSWGLTFPREIVEVFNLENPKTVLKIHPHPEQGKIEIAV